MAAPRTVEFKTCNKTSSYVVGLPKQKLIACGGLYSDAIELIDPRTQITVAKLPDSARAASLKLSSDEQYLLCTVSNTRLVKVWNLKTLKCTAKYEVDDEKDPTWKQRSAKPGFDIKVRGTLHDKYLLIQWFDTIYITPFNVKHHGEHKLALTDTGMKLEDLTNVCVLDGNTISTAHTNKFCLWALNPSTRKLEAGPSILECKPARIGKPHTTHKLTCQAALPGDYLANAHISPIGRYLSIWDLNYPLPKLINKIIIPRDDQGWIHSLTVVNDVLVCSTDKQVYIYPLTQAAPGLAEMMHAKYKLLKDDLLPSLLNVGSGQIDNIVFGYCGYDRSCYPLSLFAPARALPAPAPVSVSSTKRKRQ